MSLPKLAVERSIWREERQPLSQTQLAQLLGIPTYVVFRAVKKGYIPLLPSRLIAPETADRIKTDWERTCSRTEALELTGFTENLLESLINRGILETVRVIDNRRRILRSSIEAVMRDPNLVHRRKQPHRWTKEEGLRIGRRQARRGQTRVAALSQGEFLEKLAEPLPHIGVEWVTINEAVSLLGLGKTTLWRLAKKGELVKRKGMISAESIQAYRFSQLKIPAILEKVRSIRVAWVNAEREKEARPRPAIPPQRIPTPPRVVKEISWPAP